jgi:nicotinamide phosphoribosyltransferase
MFNYDSVILDVDSYKFSHALSYPPNTTHIYSYVESRGGVFPRTLFYGLQIWLKRHMLTPITIQDVDEAAGFSAAHGVPFHREGWERIVWEHQGRLPVEIRAVPEGMVVPTHNVLATIVNTDPNCAWLTSFLETSLLRAIWYPTTVASLSWHAKQMIRAALVKSSDDPESKLLFRMHDFGSRGVSSQESAGLGGSAHLVNFLGTDTVGGILAARRYYNEPMAGFSIPAAEHSTVTSWGRDGETDSYRNMLTQFAHPGSIVAVVSDSYDIMHAVNHIWGSTLRDEVKNSGATLVVRPDSGDPLTVPVDVVEALGERFGFETNRKGFRVLHPSVRVIQGDGMNINTIPALYNNLLARGWSAENLAVGIGGQLLQGVTRDTNRWAMKCSAAKINGEWQEVYKDPITDQGKRSKRGRLVLTRERGKWETLPVNSGWDWADTLTTVYRDGELKRDWSFKEIRERSNHPAMD